jgi:hypothetical protein
MTRAMGNVLWSEYLTAVGNLQLPEGATDLPLDLDGDTFRECTEIVECTDGRYWKSEDVVNQLCNLALPLFEKAYPGYQALFCFDNATNYAAYAPDAPRTELINLGPGGKQPLMRNGFNPLTYPECLLPRDDGQLGIIIYPAAQEAYFLSSQADFRATRSQIEEIIEDAGHLVIVYLKFHPELNWIEYYWGACKFFARRHCNYSFTGLREMVPKALESVSPSLVNKYWARSKRILNSCCADAVYGDEQFREHVYRSHRKISNTGESSSS